MPDSTDTLANSAVKYLPYLREIQRKLVILVISTLIAGVIGFIYYEKILTFIMQLFNLKGITLVMNSPYQFFSLAVNTGLATGITIALPITVYILVSFLRPALKKDEYSVLIKLIPLSFILFLGGFAFGIWILQFVISIYSGTSSQFNLTNLWDIENFFGQIIVMGVSMGILFQLPIILTALLRLHLIQTSQLTQHRRFVYLAIVIFAVLMPPTDALSMILISVPPFFLFELTLLLNYNIKK